MESYEYKLQKFLSTELINIKKPKIIEFGVREGRATKIFLDYCDKFDGNLYSIDIDDCSGLFHNKFWKFIQSRDDSYNYINKRIPSKIDLIYLDTIHTASHVEKIIYAYCCNIWSHYFFRWIRCN